MKKIYNTRGTCARQILLDINDDKTVNSVEFVGGSVLTHWEQNRKNYLVHLLEIVLHQPKHNSH